MAVLETAELGHITATLEEKKKKKQREEGSWSWPFASIPGQPGKGVGQLRACGSSEISTQDKNPGKEGSQREVLHRGASWVLQSLLFNSSVLSGTLFYGAEPTLEVVQRILWLSTKAALLTHAVGSNLISVKRGDWKVRRYHGRRSQDTMNLSQPVEWFESTLDYFRSKNRGNEIEFW